LGRGKLLVIDGTDGTGEATQTDLLIKRLLAEGYRVRTISFPRYDAPTGGPIKEYLSGAYGTAEEVGPYRASILYAADRWAASRMISDWLNAGEQVVADRYVLANIGHQGGKIADPDERDRFIKWLIDLEFGLFGIPSPDLNVILHVPPKISIDLIEGRGRQADIHERDENHLRAAEHSYLRAAERLPATVLIECVKDGLLLSRETIHELIWEEVSKML
jgi:dTMP kinase